MADQRLAAKLIPGTRALVDGFAFVGRAGVDASVFFLTHAHADHTIGR